MPGRTGRTTPLSGRSRRRRRWLPTRSAGRRCRRRSARRTRSSGGAPGPPWSRSTAFRRRRSRRSPSILPGSDFERLSRLGRWPLLAELETDRGVVVLRLRPDEAPRHGRLLRRAGEEEVLRRNPLPPGRPELRGPGGDPRGDGSGGPGYQIRDEINPLRYGRGAVGMALSGPDTGGSQFFLTHAPQPHLDGGYTVFGEAVSGRDVVDRIVRGDRIRSVRILEGVEFAATPSGKKPVPPADTGAFARGRPRCGVDAARGPRLGAGGRGGAGRRGGGSEISARALVEPFEVDVFLGTWCEDSRPRSPLRPAPRACPVSTRRSDSSEFRGRRSRGERISARPRATGFRPSSSAAPGRRSGGSSRSRPCRSSGTRCASRRAPSAHPAGVPAAGEGAK